MLTIIVGDEGFDDDEQQFVLLNPVTLEMEHSLVSLSKWESKFQKPFLETTAKTQEEVLGYIIAMLITPDITFDVIKKLTAADYDKINEYINSTQSATTFGKMPTANGPKETITSEMIYYWMVALTVPLECETWHLNRLFSLIRICNIKNSPPKKMSPSEIAVRNRELNKRRKEQIGTSG